MVQVTWGQRVKTARKRLGLTQVAAAERIGIDQSTLSKIESGGYRTLTPDLVIKLCLGLSMDPHTEFAWPASIVEIARLHARDAA